MPTKKPVFNGKVRDRLRDLVLTAPPSQLSYKLRNQSLEFFARRRSLSDCHEYFCDIATIRGNKVGPDLKQACDVRDYEPPQYTR